MSPNLLIDEVLYRLYNNMIPKQELRIGAMFNSKSIQESISEFALMTIKEIEPYFPCTNDLFTKLRRKELNPLPIILYFEDKRQQENDRKLQIIKHRRCPSEYLTMESICDAFMASPDSFKGKKLYDFKTSRHYRDTAVFNNSDFINYLNLSFEEMLKNQKEHEKHLIKKGIPADKFAYKTKRIRY